MKRYADAYRVNVTLEIEVGAGTPVRVRFPRWRRPMRDYSQPMRLLQTLPFLILFALLALAPASADGGRALETEGSQRVLALAGETTMQAVPVVIPKGARALHVLAVAPYDIDLYVHREELGEDDLDDAEYSEDSISMLEHVVVTPEEGDRFPSDATWHVHVLNPFSRSHDAVASVVAYVETEDPVLVPGRTARLEIPSGASKAKARLVLPGGLGAVDIRAEARSGVPVLEVSMRGVEAPTLRRARYASVHLAGRPDVRSGAWLVEVARPSGVPTDKPYVVGVEAALTPRLPGDDAWAKDDAKPLKGAQGARTFELDEDDTSAFFLDVSPEVRSVRLSATLEGGDVDLYATRDEPASSAASGNWEYAGWRDGEAEVLRLGGTEGLLPGRYWLKISHVAGEGGTVRLEWEARAKPFQEEDLPKTKGRLGGPQTRVEFEANEPVVWWDLAPSVGPGHWLRVLGADKDLDILLQRADTGATVARGATPLHGETFGFPENLVIPKGVPLRVGVCRWHVTFPVEGGLLELSDVEPGPPPASYFPPYRGFPRGARGRTFAASVHVDTDDGAGSGIVVSPTGLLLTCHHVIEDLKEDPVIRIAFPTKLRGRPRQLYLARIVEFVEPDDLALLEITGTVFGSPMPEKPNLPFVTIGDSRALDIETSLRIVGYGYAGSSSFGSNLNVMHGILAGVELEGDREVWLITDARLGAGNSGAGFFDPKGRLVGIHSCSYGDTGTSLCYAKPISLLPDRWVERIRAAGGEVTAR